MRYQADLDHALNSNVRPRRSGESEHSSRAQYVPPPRYQSGDGPLPSPVDDKLSRPGASPTSPSSSPNVSTPAFSTTASDAPLSPELRDNLNVIRETLYSGEPLMISPSDPGAQYSHFEWVSSRRLHRRNPLPRRSVSPRSDMGLPRLLRVDLPGHP